MTAETELKLAIDPAAATATIAALRRHPAVVAHRQGRWRRAQVTSTYLDTPDWRLAEAGVALRLRRQGKRWLQTVKGPPLPGGGAGLHSRAEYEWPIAGPALEPTRLATTPWRQLLGNAISEALLAPRYTTDFERRSVALLYPDGTRAELCIDVGEIRADAPRRGREAARTRRVPIAEVEIELATGNVAHLYELGLALTRDLPLKVATVNKAERGFALVQRLPDGWRAPVRAHAVELAAAMPAPDALAVIARACLQQIAANAPGLLADNDPEWVHQMRIGTRRLRSCLALAARYLPDEQLAPLIAEQKWLAGILGTARDWDVFATETVPPFAVHFAADPALAADIRRLRARIARRRSAAHAAVRAAVRSPQFQQLVLGIAALLSAAPTAVALPLPDAGAEGTPTIKVFARKVLERRHRKLLERADACVAGTPEDRHALRIAAKKLRYAAEFFTPLLQRKRARSYVAALAGLQDVLGRGNDAVTAARLVTQVARSDRGTVAAALQGWVAAQGAATLPPLADAWRRFARTHRFWAD